MPRPLDPDLRDLLAEAVKVLEGPGVVPTPGGNASPRFLVSAVLRQVLTSSDPGIVNWGTGYLRKLQREWSRQVDESTKPPIDT
jgi:hypothetical protein